MELSDAARRRRMVRSFSGDPVPSEVLDRVLELACSAPSAGNTGGWDAVVLTGPEETSRFWEATTTADWRTRSRRWPGLGRAPVVVALFVDPDAYRARYREPDKARSGLGGDGEPQAAGVAGGAGAAGADTADLSGEGAGPWPVPYWFVDGGFAAMVMLLAAVDAGLGACFLGNFRGETALRSALGVPDDRRYIGAVLMGEPGGVDPPSPSLARGRRRSSEVVHRGRW
ncbi:MAG TPA: nitroreductase family protein [Acidimicrobiales bacterium]|nr:nitroreductase family protein [Acidimicrobiales bacterium]